MAFEFDALVGYLYIVGGRAISIPPPGTLVQLASKRVARGREADTFFALVTPSGDYLAPATYYEALARKCADRYFAGSSSVTSGLRSILTEANSEMHEARMRDGDRQEANILCGVMRGTDLFVAKVGAGVGVVHDQQGDGGTLPFPADFAQDDVIFSAPLGVQPMPDMRLGRYQITPGLRLILGDATLVEQPFDLLTDCIARPDLGAVLAGLREAIHNAAAVMVLEFVRAEQPVALPVREGVSTFDILSRGSRGTKTGEQTGAVAEAALTPPAPGTPRRSRVRGAFIRRALGAIGRFGVAIFEQIGRIFDRLVPPLPEGKRGWLASSSAAALALVVPIVIVVAVVLLWVGGAGETEFDQCVNQADAAAATARQIASSDVTGTVAGWNAVLTVVSSCESLRPNDAALLAIRTEARSILDRLQNVARRSLVPIYAFPNAQLTQAVLQGDDLYVLDGNNQQVYRLTLAGDGRAVLAGSYTPIPAMRRGGSVINFSVGDLIDIAWVENGAGLSQSNVIAALDRNGVLIACPPRFLQDCTAQRLPGSETWQRPTAIQFWEGRLYLLDPAANQIWRYDPTGGTFAGVPLEYFAGVGRPDIRSAVDFAITGAGDVYLLLNTGVVARFRGGQQLPFAFTFPDTQSIDAPQALFLNTNPIAQGLFIVERGQRTIFETTMAGTFISAYRANDESLFATLSNVIADSNRGVIYALSGNTVFVFPREDAADAVILAPGT